MIKFELKADIVAALVKVLDGVAGTRMICNYFESKLIEYHAANPPVSTPVQEKKEKEK